MNEIHSLSIHEIFIPNIFLLTLNKYLKSSKTRNTIAKKSNKTAQLQLRKTSEILNATI